MRIIKSITVLGRRWTNHFSVSILVDGKQVHHIPLDCGTGDYYLQAAFEWLDEQKVTDRRKGAMGTPEPPWRYCEDRDIALHYEAADVNRKRDL